MAEARTLYVLMPFRPTLDPVYTALQETGREASFQTLSSKEDPESDIEAAILQRIYDATVVLADLTFLNANVLYELGVANALSKECVMICQAKGLPNPPSDSWIVSEDGRTGRLPFDLARFRVIPYSDEDKNLKELKRRVVERLKEPTPLISPVNRALEKF